MMRRNLPRSPMFWAVSLGHATNDTFMSMGPVLLAFLSSTVLPMSAVQIGIMISARQIVGAVSQPVFGHYADRGGGRLLGAGGVGLTVGLLSLSLVMALTGEFWLMAVPFALSALGSGAFHPVGVLYASEVEQAHTNRNTAYFFLFGQVGLAMGPALAGGLLSLSGPEGTAVTLLTFLPIFGVALVGSLSVAFMGVALPAQPLNHSEAAAATVPADTRPFMQKLRAILTPALGLLALMVFLRSVAQLGAVGFIPVLFERKGWDPAQYGLITSAFWVASAVMGVYLGRVADRWDSRYVIALSLGMGAPALFLLPLADGVMAFLLAMAAGALLGGSHSIIVIMAQRLIPMGKAFASGVILGYIFISGALGTFVFGLLADGTQVSAEGVAVGGIGLGSTFQIAAGLALLAALLALALPPVMSTHKRALPASATAGD